MSTHITEASSTSAPWMDLARWRALKVPNGKGWRVVSEHMVCAPEPHTFAEPVAAQKRADELNAEDHEAMRRNLR